MSSYKSRHTGEEIDNAVDAVLNSTPSAITGTTGHIVVIGPNGTGVADSQMALGTVQAFINNTTLALAGKLDKITGTSGNFVKIYGQEIIDSEISTDDIVLKVPGSFVQGDEGKIVKVGGANMVTAANLMVSNIPSMSANAAAADCLILSSGANKLLKSSTITADQLILKSNNMSNTKVPQFNGSTFVDSDVTFANLTGLTGNVQQQIGTINSTIPGFVYYGAIVKSHGGPLSSSQALWESDSSLTNDSTVDHHTYDTLTIVDIIKKLKSIQESMSPRKPIVLQCPLANGDETPYSGILPNSEEKYGLLDIVFYGYNRCTVKYINFRNNVAKFWFGESQQSGNTNPPTIAWSGWYEVTATAVQNS